jgi:hypothetical protein
LIFFCVIYNSSKHLTGILWVLARLQKPGINYV